VQKGATHVPNPSQWVPPVEHELPAAIGLLIGTPLSHTSSVHGLLSSTRTQAVPPVPLLLVAVLLPPAPLLLVAVLLPPVPLLLVAVLLLPPPPAPDRR
jgi:hypothetical protein